MNRQLHRLVAVLMRLLSVPSALSLSDQSDSASAAPQTAGSIAEHLPEIHEKSIKNKTSKSDTLKLFKMVYNYRWSTSAKYLCII